MLTNRDILDSSGHFSVPLAIKKMVTIPDTTLNPEESKGFIERMWDQSNMKYYARKELMKDHTKNIRGISWGTGDFFAPEAEFDSTKIKTAFGSENILLTSKELRAGILIKDKDYEDLNIGTAAQFKAHLFSMAQKRMALELEQLCWLGDTHDLNGYDVDNPRSVDDGWRYWLDNSGTGETYEVTRDGVAQGATLLDASNTVTARASSFTVTTLQAIAEQRIAAPYNLEIKFGRMLKELPSQYTTDGLGDLRYFCNDKVLVDYTEQLQDRGTPLGDMAVMGKTFTTANGIPIIPCPLMPVTMKIDTVDNQKEAWVDTAAVKGTLQSGFPTTGGDLTDVVLTKNNNFGVGIHLELVMEAERSAKDRGNYYYFTTRICTFVGDVVAAVLLKRLKLIG
jgi:hypothetical protein